MGAPVIQPDFDKNKQFNWLVPAMGYDVTNDKWRPLLVNSDGSQAVSISNGVVLSGIERTVAASTVTSNGTVTAGKKSIIFNVAIGATVTIGGASVVAGQSYSFNAPAGDTLGQVSYTCSGSLTILTVT